MLSLSMREGRFACNTPAKCGKGTSAASSLSDLSVEKRCPRVAIPLRIRSPAWMIGKHKTLA
jgi:hypothetical protein